MCLYRVCFWYREDIEKKVELLGWICRLEWDCGYRRNIEVSLYFGCRDIEGSEVFGCRDIEVRVIGFNDYSRYCCSCFCVLGFVVCCVCYS